MNEKGKKDFLQKHLLGLSQSPYQLLKQVTIGCNEVLQSHVKVAISLLVYC